MEDLMERNIKEEDVERKVLAGQFKEYWKYRALFLVDSSPLVENFDCQPLHGSLSFLFKI
jgi:hypothetical protein